VFPREVSILLKISRCAAPVRERLRRRAQRAPQGDAEGVAGLDLGLRDPLRRAGKTASVSEPRDRSCECFQSSPQARFC